MHMVDAVVVGAGIAGLTDMLSLTGELGLQTQPQHRTGDAFAARKGGASTRHQDLPERRRPHEVAE
jgi:aspartate oxidase